MKAIILIAALVLPPTGGAPMQAVTISLHKDTCEKFQQSGALIQEFYLKWASSHIKRKFGIRFSSTDLSQPMRAYCAANPSTVIEDASDAVETQLSATAKP